jgi:hypothetical protein
MLSKINQAPCGQFTRLAFIREGLRNVDQSMTLERRIEIWRNAATALRQSARRTEGQEQLEYLFAATRCSAVAIHLITKGTRFHA